ncbi:hypothetical protein [Paenisporosarcina sp. TG20]|nr:hypothetical protein [Paenisporosarcina sp. TG20]
MKRSEKIFMSVLLSVVLATTTAASVSAEKISVSNGELLSQRDGE